MNKRRIDNAFFYIPVILFAVMMVFLVLMSGFALVMQNLVSFGMGVFFCGLIFLLWYFYLIRFKRVYFDDSSVYIKPMFGSDEEKISIKDVTDLKKPGGFESVTNSGAVYFLFYKAGGEIKKIRFYRTIDFHLVNEFIEKVNESRRK